MPAQPPRSLRELAAARALPDHQVMDAPTLDWIAGNPPPPTADTPALTTDEILLLRPDASWFTSRDQADGLHGISHGARTCVLAFLLARAYRLDRAHTAALCTAAAVHDCRRHDDRADPEHGQRAATWFTEHAEMVLSAVGQEVSAELRADVAAAIAVHNRPYDAFAPGQRDAYQHAPHLTDLLKAADCLDRYRLPLSRWWPNTTHLRLTIPAWLSPFAHGLVVHSERARLDGASHHDAVTHALTTLTR
ncbi:HD domain-containing protein [Streptomyces sp. NPDC047049]|uniref:HD domain-containing protein n=1 Tax=Streptomyces sp. NPDC047049 TaxID=3156688 RepID=UPI0033D22C17